MYLLAFRRIDGLGELHPCFAEKSQGSGRCALDFPSYFTLPCLTPRRNCTSVLLNGGGKLAAEIYLEAFALWLAAARWHRNNSTRLGFPNTSPDVMRRRLSSTSTRFPNADTITKFLSFCFYDRVVQLIQFIPFRLINLSINFTLFSWKKEGKWQENSPKTEDRVKKASSSSPPPQGTPHWRTKYCLDS